MEPTVIQWFVTFDKKPVMEPVTENFDKVIELYDCFCELFDKSRLEIVEIKIYHPEKDGESK